MKKIYLNFVTIINLFCAFTFCNAFMEPDTYHDPALCRQNERLLDDSNLPSRNVNPETISTPAVWNSLEDLDYPIFNLSSNEVTFVDELLIPNFDGPLISINQSLPFIENRSQEKNIDHPSISILPFESKSKIINPDDYLRRAFVHLSQNQPLQAIENCNIILMTREIPDVIKAEAFINRGIGKSMLDCPLGAIYDFNIALVIPSIEHYIKVNAFSNLGFNKNRLGDYESAIQDYNAVLQISGISNSLKAHILSHRGVSKANLGYIKEAIQDYFAAISIPEIMNCTKVYTLEKLNFAKVMYVKYFMN